MKKFENIIVLSAGESSRFWPFNDKNLFKFLNKPLLLYQIEKFLPYARKILIVANKKNIEAIKNIASVFNNVDVILQQGKGQASALLSVNNEAPGETLVVNNIDVFNEKTIFTQIFSQRNKYGLILTAKEMKEYFPGGYLRYKKNQVLELIEKPKPEEKPSNMVRLVVDYFANFTEFVDILKSLKNPARDGAFEEGLNIYLKKVKATFVNYQDYWYFLKYPWHVLLLKYFFLSQIKKYVGKNVLVDKTAKIEGDVYLEDGVKIYEYSKIVGPCYIGRNTIVGNYSLIKESIIGQNCLVGGYSEVTRSYLGNKVYLHRNYLGDSVVENNVLFGAGAVCANFRFDEDKICSPVNGALVNTQRKKLGAIIGSNVKVGVNASLMPGVKIGANNVIMPGAVVKKDIL